MNTIGVIAGSSALAAKLADRRIGGTSMNESVEEIVFKSSMFELQKQLTVSHYLRNRQIVRQRGASKVRRPDGLSGRQWKKQRKAERRASKEGQA